MFTIKEDIQVVLFTQIGQFSEQDISENVETYGLIGSTRGFLYSAMPECNEKLVIRNKIEDYRISFQNIYSYVELNPFSLTGLESSKGLKVYKTVYDKTEQIYKTDLFKTGFVSGEEGNIILKATDTYDDSHYTTLTSSLELCPMPVTNYNFNLNYE